jgi:peptide deformylase
MSILKISRLGHPILRRVADELAPEALANADLQRLIDDMVATMVDEEGIGLAAPQVHASVRLVVLGDPEAEADDGDSLPLTVLANPVWRFRSTETDEAWEGCLSLPGLRGWVPRSLRVVVGGVDRTGRAIEITAQGYLARVLQHEIDHLDGILYPDRMADLTRLTFLDEYRRYWQPDPDEDDEDD